MTSPRPLHDRALDNLRYIRQTMERAGPSTGVPGWGQIAVGTTALAAALVAARQRSPELWLATWLGAAIVALAIGGWTMVRKAYAVDDPILSGPGRRFWLSFLTPMAVGGLLTVVLRSEEHTSELQSLAYLVCRLLLEKKKWRKR